jgi:hypothetical protein
MKAKWLVMLAVLALLCGAAAGAEEAGAGAAAGGQADGQKP